jgi:probable blue pigment (indigoidine) exporter
VTEVSRVQGSVRVDESRANLALLGAVVLTSVNYSVMKVGLGEFDPLVFCVLRFAVGGAALLAISRLREGTLRLGSRDAAVVCLVGLLGIALQQGTLAFAIADAGAADSAMLAATVPLMTAVIAAVTGLDRLRRRHWIAVVGGLVGVSLVVYAGASAGRPQSTVAGNAFALVNAFVAAAAAFPLAYLLRRHSATRVLGYEMLVGTAIIVPFAVPALARLDPARIDTAGWTSLAFTTVFSGALAALLYFVGLRQVGPARAALFQYLAPPLAVAFAVAFLGETVTAWQLLGGAIVMGSIAISPQIRRREGAPAAGVPGPGERAHGDDSP